MAYSHEIPKTHLDRAGHRMPKTGKTRFHKLVEDASFSSRELMAWLESGQAPWNTRDRNGLHPLASIVSVYGNSIADERSPLGEMPKWWNEYHPNDTQQDWEATQATRRKQHKALARQLFEQAKEQVDFSRLTIDDTQQVLGSLPLKLFLEEIELIVDPLLQAGLPLEGMTYHGNAITPAMHCVLRRPSEDLLEYWLDKAHIPIDPPDDTPGLLSAMMINGWLVKNTKEPLLAKLFAREDIDPERPVCDRTWESDESRLYRLTNHLAYPTLQQQAMHLGATGLTERMLKHKTATEKMRIDALNRLIKQYPQRDQYPLRDPSLDEDARKARDIASQIQALLSPTLVRQDKRVWKDESPNLVRLFLEHVWVHDEATDEKSPPRLIWNAMRQAGLHGQIDADWTRNVDFSKIISQKLRLTPACLVRQELDPSGFLSEVFGAAVREDVIHWLATAATAFTFSQPDKIRLTMEWLIGNDPISPQLNNRLTNVLFRAPVNGLAVPCVLALVDTVWKHQSPTTDAWDILQTRLRSAIGESQEVIIGLAQFISRWNVPVPQGNPSFLTPSLPSVWVAQDQDASVKGNYYTQSHEWNQEIAASTQRRFNDLAIPLLNGNLEDRMQAFHRFFMAKSMQTGETLDPALSKLVLSALTQLHAAGANPDGKPWFETLDANEPFAQIWSQVVEKHLQDHTTQAGMTQRRRRL